MKILLINPHDSPDYLYRAIMEGLVKTDVELYLTHPDRLCSNVVSDENAVKIANEVDFIFVIWDKEKPSVRPIPKYYLLDKINLPEKTVYIDGSEYNWTAYPNRSTETLNPNMIGKCKWYFKRECLPEHIEQGVIPLPFASIDSDFKHLPTVQKDIDVLCGFGQTGTGQRAIAVQACEELKAEGYNIINHRVPNYDELMNRALITIDAHGGGECNARTFQVMANNSLLFMEKYNIILPHLVPNKHYIDWANGEELKIKLREHLENREKISILTKQSYENVLEFHTSKKRVDYIINTIRE
jgi:hypothetical protein